LGDEPLVIAQIAYRKYLQKTDAPAAHPKIKVWDKRVGDV